MVEARAIILSIECSAVAHSPKDQDGVFVEGIVPLFQQLNYLAGSKPLLRMAA